MNGKPVIHTFLSKNEVMSFNLVLSFAMTGVHFWLDPETNQRDQGLYIFLTLI